MNINQLRFVIAVLETGSFSKAAEACCVTQPSLSNAIALLEDQLGSKLFSRSSRHVRLTHFGETMFPLIQSVLTAKDDLLETAKTYHHPEHKLIRIGMTPLINVTLLHSVIEPFTQKYPDVEITFKECLMDDLNARLVNNQIDLAFVEKSQLSSNVENLLFYTERLYYLPKEDGTKQKLSSPVIIKNIKDQTYVLAEGCGLSDLLRSLFKKQGYNLLPYRGRALSYHVIEEWAGLGIGSAILPLSKISDNHKLAVPVNLKQDVPATLSLMLSWHDENTQFEHIKNFMSFFKKVRASIVGGLAA